jgi:NTP pyrophosphatase (non-canonical NTP hydrolase)
MQTFKALELSVIRWAEQRHIIPHSTPQAQFLKMVSEMGELADGIGKQDRELIIDSVGDVLVCLINMCALLDLDVTECLGHAWDEIKDRKGHMNANGVFIKE